MEQVRADPSVVLDNGLPVIEIPMPNRPETAIALALPGGARYERPGETGVAHFLEHMVFKGTESYPTPRVLNRSAEHLGGELNAATSDEYVEFTALVTAESAMQGIDLVADVSGRALLEEQHLETERSVVLQEIADDRDDPSTLADYRLIAALFRGHRLATPTSGEAADVARLGNAQLRSFRERQWSPAGGVFVVGGNLDHFDRGRLAGLLDRLPSRSAPPPPVPVAPFERRIEVEERDSEVAHLRLAYDLRDFDLSDARDRAIADVFCEVLGGPPASRLPEELREERGLCYEAYSYWWGYRDRAMLSVDCSMRPADVVEAYERIEAIIAELSAKGPTDEETRRARTYSTTDSAVALQSPSVRVDRAVYLTLACDDTRIDPAAHLEALESVTRGDLAAFAARVAPGPCVGCVGAVEPALFE